MRGTLLQVLGAGLMVAAFVAFFILQYFRGTHALVPGWQVYAVGLPIIFVLLVAGSACYSTGRKISAKAAQAAAAQDLRPPVLYLRSFPDDPTAGGGPGIHHAHGRRRPRPVDVICRSGHH
jgi:hypothetical protein